MIPYKYAYLVGCVVYIAIWALLFKKRKEYRSEMLLLGILGGTVGPIVNYYFYRQDWWRPEYFTGIHGGLEDIVYGFTTLGIVAVLYEELFEQRYTRKVFLKKLDYVKALPKFITLLSIILIPTWIMFYVFGFHSLWGSVVGFLLGGFYVLYRRPDLIKDSIYSAVIMPFVALPGCCIAWIFYTRNVFPGSYRQILVDG
jgi:hypothetical protein